MKNTNSIGIALVCKKFNKLYKDGSIHLKEIRLTISNDSKLMKDKFSRQKALEAIGRSKFLETLIIEDGLKLGIVSSKGFQEQYFVHTGPELVPKLALIDENDEIGAGYFLVHAIKNCPRIRHIELRNIYYLSKDFLDKNTMNNIIHFITNSKGYGAMDWKINTNSMYLLAIGKKRAFKKYD